MLFRSDGWIDEYESIGEYLASFGGRMPAALIRERQRIAALLAEGQIESETVGTP